MKCMFLESVNSPHTSGTFEAPDREDEKELIRLMARSCDADELAHELELETLGRGEGVVTSSVYNLFGRLVRKPRSKPLTKAQKIKILEEGARHHPLEFQCLDAYRLSLCAESTDPAMITDSHIAEEIDATKHPEAMEDECFLGNLDVDGFKLVTWKTKRLGNVAFSDSGRRLSRHFRPLFVARSELLEAGFPAEVREEMIAR